MRFLIFLLFVDSLNCPLVVGQSILNNDLCKVKKVITNHKLFKEKEKIWFNNSCQITKKIKNRYPLTFKNYRRGFIDSIVSSDLSVEVRKFDSKGLLLNDFFLSSNSIVKLKRFYEYDTFGRLCLVRIKSVNSEKLIEYFYENSKAKHSNKEVIFINNQVHSEVEYSRDSHGNALLINTYYFDNRGDRYLDNRQIGGFECSPCRYVYDKRGNWIRQYMKVVGKAEQLYAIRKIWYFD